MGQRERQLRESDCQRASDCHGGDTDSAAAGHSFRSTDTLRYLEFLYYYQHAPTADTTTWMTGDFNYDGKINVNDYLMLLAGYGQQSGTLSADEQITDWAPIQEPATLVLLALGTAAVLRRRRSKAW